MEDFSGVKIALLNNQNVVVSLRDDKPGLNFAGMWDLPGGGREGEETPLQCVQRELQEELGLDLSESDILWTRIYPGMIDPTRNSYFMVATVSQTALNSVVFGDEGQEWKVMPIHQFLTDDNVVPRLKGRLADFLATPEGAGYKGA